MSKLIASDDSLSISTLLSEISETIIPIEHSVVDGVYTRIAYAKAGCIVVGCTHKKGGTAILLSGGIKQIDGDNKYEIFAPKIFNTEAGTQRVALALTDCTYATIHSVIATTVEEAEKEIFEEVPQITRIKNSFNELLLENKITDNNVQEFMDSLPVTYEHSDTYIIEKSIIDGLGSMARKDIFKNEIIGVAIKDGNRMPLARYVNHSDIPNAKFIDNDDGNTILVAIVSIPMGNEIFVNYKEKI